MTRARTAFAVGVVTGVLAAAVVAYALTTEQLFNSWFDDSDNTIRVVLVE